MWRPSAGDEPLFAERDERTVYLVARELTDTGQVSQASYDAARELLGEAGMVKLVALCGYYTLISFLLAFGVPIPPNARPMWPATGPERLRRAAGTG